MSRFTLDTLKNALQDVDAECMVIPEQDAMKELIALLEQEGAETVALTSDTLLAEMEVENRLNEAGFHSVTANQGSEDPDSWKRSLAECAVGISSAAAVAKETGTALLAAGSPDQRAITLLPEHHVLMIREAQLVEDVGELMQVLAGSSHAAENCIFVTGPSRTADIEKQLVLGAHGPARLTMFILQQ